jgi:plasmid stabilization system protein ParE
VRRVAYHRLAARELLEGVRYYDRQVPGVGEQFLSEVERVLAFIKAEPLLGRIEGERRRSWPVHRFPYRIVYELDPERFRIIAVAHMSRRPGYWKRRVE